MTIKEVAPALGISPGYLGSLLRSGVIPATKLGRAWEVDPNLARQALADHRDRRIRRYVLVSSDSAASILEGLVPGARRLRQRPGAYTLSPWIDLREGEWCFEIDDITRAEAHALVEAVRQHQTLREAA